MVGGGLEYLDMLRTSKTRDEWKDDVWFAPRLLSRSSNSGHRFARRLQLSYKGRIVHAVGSSVADVVTVPHLAGIHHLIGDV